MKKSRFRKYETIVFPAWVGCEYEITEVRSTPILVWLIDMWFLWVHEWLWLISKPLHLKLMWPFCVAYSIYIARWASGYERIDDSKRGEQRG